MPNNITARDNKKYGNSLDAKIKFENFSNEELENLVRNYYKNPVYRFAFRTMFRFFMGKKHYNPELSFYIPTKSEFLITQELLDGRKNY